MSLQSSPSGGALKYRAFGGYFLNGSSVFRDRHCCHRPKRDSFQGASLDRNVESKPRKDPTGITNELLGLINRMLEQHPYARP